MLSSFWSVSIRRLLNRPDELRRSHRRFRPAIENLEDRVVPASFVVNTLADENDGIGVGGVSLRDAINAANASGGTNEIQFTGAAAAGVIQILTANGPLPAIAINLAIHGPGADHLTVRGQVGNNFSIFSVSTGATAEIDGLTISGGNYAASGGGIRNSGTLTVANCVITGNTQTGSTLNANGGGGIANLAGGILTLQDSTVSGNQSTAIRAGGAGVFNAGTATLLRCLLDDNTATGIGVSYGAGFLNTGVATVQNCTFLDNHAVAGFGGGGGFFNGFGGNLKVINSTLTGNTSGFGGGAAYNGGSLTLVNCTLSGNTTAISGGGLYNIATLAMENTIIAGNHGSHGPDLVGAVLVGSLNNLIGDGTGATGLVNGDTYHNQVGGGSNPVIDPKLGLLGYYGGTTQVFPLLAGSPAIDAGTDVPLTTDQRGTGFPRKLGPAVDIGAFEYNHPPTANDDSYTVLASGSLQVTNAANGVLANDSDLDNDTLSASLTSGPTHGTLSFNTDGTFSFKPALGYSGSDSFTYQLLDGNPHAAPVTATVHITVRPSLDVDGNGTADALTDGILILRYLFGFSGSTLTSGALAAGATRTDPASITHYLDGARSTVLDADGNGHADALTDGIVILRYLFGFTGSTLTSGAISPGASRAAPVVIQAYLDSYNPKLGKLVAESLGPGAAPADMLTAEELQTITAVAIARWEATDLTAVAKAKLESAQVQVADLAGGTMGQTHGNAVLIDRTADGNGWFIDPTPFADTEFTIRVDSNQFDATSTSPAFGRMDLLTVVMHELGLVMGLADIDPSVQAHALMTDVLAPGVRRLP